MTTGKLSVYIHLPFCSKKCPYCHFYVIPYRKDLEDRLIEAILKEWNLKVKFTPDIDVISIYFGGGTPSLVSSNSLQKLVDHIAVYAKSPPEITIEANPESLSLDQCKQWKEMGINRVSIGAQSFVDKELIELGRNHTAKTTVEAVHMAYDQGIDNISIDLMYEQPFQSIDDWSQSLEIASQLPIEHVSLYNLTIEPHTGFYRKKDQLKLPSEEEGLEMLKTAMHVMKNNGFSHYEISAFCKSRPSVHNTGYWLGRPFWGLGPSAFSFIDGERIQNTPNINRYLSDVLEKDCLSESFRESLSHEARLKELFVIQLRMRQGVHVGNFEDKWGLLSSKTHAVINDLLQENLLEKTRNVKLTDKGLFFFDTLASRLI